MKIEAAIFGSICDKCKQPIMNQKGIAIIAGEDSQTYCQECYISTNKERLKILIEVCEDKISQVAIEKIEFKV